MDISLVLAGEADLPALNDLARAVSRYPDSLWDDSYPDEALLRRDVEQKGLYRVEADGRLAGMIALERDEEDLGLVWPTADENPCMLSRLAIHPAFHGKGLLEPVFLAAVKQCGALGYRTLRLLVAAELERVIRVYERCGFTRAGEARLWGEDYFLYEKSLRP